MALRLTRGRYDVRFAETPEDVRVAQRLRHQVFIEARLSGDSSARAGSPFDVLIIDAAAEAAAPVRDVVVNLNAQSAQIANIAVTLDL
ncbi:MAG: hypothetical protein AAFR16_09965, partial [Pseudomonadota bacterium]